MGREGFARLVWLTAPLKRPPDVRNVAGAVHRFEVEARRTAHRGLEAIGLPDGPGGHVATVAIAPDASSLCVGKWPLQGRVEDRHQVQIVFATPVAAHLLGELAPI